jgi:hypothetical protein
MVLGLAGRRAIAWGQEPLPDQSSQTEFYALGGKYAWICIAQAPPQVAVVLPVQGTLHDSLGNSFRDASGVFSKLLHQHSEPRLNGI